MISLRRHWLARIEPDAESLLPDRARAWHAAGRPFVVARRRGPEGTASLGFCTALTDPANDPRPGRFGFTFPVDRIAATTPPPPLARVLTLISRPQGRDSLAVFVEAGAAAGLEFRVFGSWMWESLLREPFRHAASDLDLLVAVRTAGEAATAVELFLEAERSLPFPIDGELSLPTTGELHWKELSNGQDEVLLKSLTGVWMARRDALFP